ncbi:hypothetical protein [Marinobacterium arenosum]|uniref:hypothetical protein n=1 Tax=Marinobacterium arenosum TaxID=2862496 RepID=UPI001C97DAF1|nr:hypothetical protein [Marinobacterium arenosum]MBY4679063.1 hypothetical protein [Marinobacterium arenosum]
MNLSPLASSHSYTSSTQQTTTPEQRQSLIEQLRTGNNELYRTLTDALDHLEADRLSMGIPPVEMIRKITYLEAELRKVIPPEDMKAVRVMTDQYRHKLLHAGS